MIYQNGWTYAPRHPDDTSAIPVFRARRNRLTGTIWREDHDGSWSVVEGWRYFYYNHDGDRIHL